MATITRRSFMVRRGVKSYLEYAPASPEEPLWVRIPSRNGRTNADKNAPGAGSLTDPVDDRLILIAPAFAHG
jgi:hypothetical protein